MLLVGDWAQLSAVESGGAFGLIARSIEDAPELTDVRRFQHEWAKTATLGFRTGALDVVQTDAERGRILDGDDLTETAFSAWRADMGAGRRSVLLAVDSVTVAQKRDALLAERAR